MGFWKKIFKTVQFRFQQNDHRWSKEYSFTHNIRNGMPYLRATRKGNERGNERQDNDEANGGGSGSGSGSGSGGT
jgi:hypothetical protein